MKKKFLIGPIPILVLTLIATGAALWMSIYSNLEFNEKLKKTITQFKLNEKMIADSETWTTTVLLIIFFVIIIAGMATIFTYYQKLQNLYQLQENFISNFTHELKTPVASIKLYLETMMKRDVEPEKRQEFIKLMLKDTDRLHQNIEQILQTSKIESKKDFFKTQDIELGEFLGEFVKKVEHLFPDRLTYENKLKGNSYTKIDPILFESLLINLINNGVKYNSSEKPEVKIILTSNLGTLRIDVVDNGIGIDIKDHKKIFKKFFRVFGSEKKIKGTGLGLYLVSQIMNLHKGKISLTSEMGKGSVFHLELPRLYPAGIPNLRKGIKQA
jgi:signal transduction histidine kinase